jgi:predicted nuclease of predicted toxin-antitoxin system
VSSARPKLKLFLDEGVPNSVGRIFEDAGHEVTYLNRTVSRGSPDQVVCVLAEAHEAILVAQDRDMKMHASRYGVSRRRFTRLSLLKLSCRESRASERVSAAMSLIEHEWTLASSASDRRIFIEIGDSMIRTHR